MTNLIITLYTWWTLTRLTFLLPNNLLIVDIDQINLILRLLIDVNLRISKLQTFLIGNNFYPKQVTKHFDPLPTLNTITSLILNQFLKEVLHHLHNERIPPQTPLDPFPTLTKLLQKLKHNSQALRRG